MKRAAIYLRRAGVIGRFRANACPAAGRRENAMALGGQCRRTFPSPLANISVAAGEYFRRHRGVFLRGNNVSSLRPRAWRHRRQSERRQRPASH